MSFGKELLFSCIVVMHLSFVASRPLDLGKLEKNMEYIRLPLQNLMRAEGDYVRLIFHNDRPTDDELKPLEGITLPVGDTLGEIVASVCNITGYLDHLPTIIRNLTAHHHHHHLVQNVTVFINQFKMAIKSSTTDHQHDVRECPDKYVLETPKDTFEMKLIGLRMINSTAEWLEGFLKRSSPDLS